MQYEFNQIQLLFKFFNYYSNFSFIIEIFQAGPAFQQGNTRFHTNDIPFESGVVLTRFTGSKPFCAPKAHHNNNS